MHYYIEVLEKYAVFKGRARRAEYWYFILFNLIIAIVLNIISKVIGEQRNILSHIYGLAVLVPSIAVSIRRFHDIGKTGWWELYFILMYLAVGLLMTILIVPIILTSHLTASFYILMLIPLAIFVWSTIWMCTASQSGDNKYGPNPKSVTPPSSTPPTPSIPETPTQVP